VLSIPLPLAPQPARRVERRARARR